VVAVTQPGNGTVVINADNTVTYTPNAGFRGEDRFTYTVDNGHGKTATATVTVTVLNNPPVARDDTANTLPDSQVVIRVLANDTDSDGDPLTVTSVTPPANGTVAQNADGTVSYTPAVEFLGTDNFTYTISDGQGGTATATVTVTVFVPPAPVPRTGQTTCYDQGGAQIACAGTGQDGDKQAGVAWPMPRFVDNGDGTVTDNLTGLIWLKDANCFGRVDWQTALNAANTLAAANDGQCGLADGSVPGDWRLPNVKELQSLIDYGQAAPALSAGHPFSGVQLAIFYWSSTSTSDVPGLVPNIAWYVEFGDGGINVVAKAVTNAVWPVRDGPNLAVGQLAPVPRTGQTTCYDQNNAQIACAGTGQDGDKLAGVAWPTPRFIDNGNGTVTDQLTGLIWLKDANCSAISPATQQTALDKANGLANGQCGLTDGSAPGDWRLPNVGELESLIDYGQRDPALPAGHPFTGVQSAYGVQSTYYRSSTSLVRPSRPPRLVYLFNGYVAQDSGVALSVWPVRGGQ
jgi:hypothetical protein